MLVDESHEAAIGVLKRNTTSYGLKASENYYNKVFSRDAFISFLGANLLQDEELLQSARSTVETFAKTPSPLGQIANHYDLSLKRPQYGFSGATDASTWYIIGVANLFGVTKDQSLLDGPLDAAINAYRWLRYQDANNLWLIDSPEAADWMDASVQRTGKTLYNNVLFLLANRCIDSLCSEASKPIDPVLKLDRLGLELRFTEFFLPTEEALGRIARYSPRYAELFIRVRPLDLSQKHFIHYVSFSRIDSRFDTLSNLLCVLAGLSPSRTSASILDTIVRENLARPYPARNIDRPYSEGDAGYDHVFDIWEPEQHRSTPYNYHNGGVWPSIGGFYVWTLYSQGKDAANSELEMLARANSLYKQGETVGFNEWLDGKSGEPKGQYGQSWNAGAYIAAYQASKGRDPLEFIR
jgi:glycogen debranching enzyme